MARTHVVDTSIHICLALVAEVEVAKGVGNLGQSTAKCKDRMQVAETIAYAKENGAHCCANIG